MHEVRQYAVRVWKPVQSGFQPEADALDCLAWGQKAIRLRCGQGDGDEAHAGRRRAAQAGRAVWAEIGLAVEDEAVRGLIVEEVAEEICLQR